MLISCSAQMSEPSSLFAAVLSAALAEVKAQAVPVFTFALYHDHESEAVSVCVDTEDNSNRVVAGINRYNMKYFMQAVSRGDLKEAGLWQANVGRNLSLGDFKLMNVARTDLKGIEINNQFYVVMLQALIERQRSIAELAPNRERLLLACSGAESEVQYVWSLPEIDA